ncbi:hypothetical protein E4T56_gene757 [Termitomyces sp. T112]|nr:hypothetical protein E4T56_gene757 [Termitomyces sp. T112]
MNHNRKAGPALSPAQLAARQHKIDAARLQQNMPKPDSPPTPPLPPATTRISRVPPSAIPALAPSEIAQVQSWMAADSQYEAVYRAMKDRIASERESATARGWWERGQAQPRRREPFEVRYPRRKERERRRGRREGLRLPRKLDVRDVNKPEQLVPIRLEFDVEHYKMRDTFVWNLNDPVVTPEAFAQSLVEDYALSPSYHAVIAKAIQDQLGDFRAHSGIFAFDADADAEAQVQVVDLNEKEAEAVRGKFASDAEERWWAQWKGRVRRAAKGRKRRRLDVDDDGVDADVEEDDEDGDDVCGWEKGKRLDQMEVDEAKMQEEMRILIRLDVIVGSMKLDDQFEWDLESETVTPEEFAEVYVQDLGLNGEFKTAIAHSIREQIQTYQKSLFLVGHPSDGSPVQDEDLRMSFLPTLSTAARPTDQIPSFTPTLNYLSDGSIDRHEKEREKDMNRRRKRNTRGRRGIALPDREPIRTYRTPAIGFAELDAATLAAANAVNAPVSRRAAAAAASLTIANMVAVENGTAFLPQQVVLPTMGGGAGAVGVGVGAGMGVGGAPGQGQGQEREKEGKGKGKGHFKAPAFPPEVLRPRAHVGTPTPSTAADVATLPAPLENDPPLPLAVMSTVVSSGAGGTGTQTPDGRTGGKGITAKRAKELEREAKEKEFADGQHPNVIDGVWHCSNCGCPDSIAVGRRKGPLGDKSQCGICGKYWHRHRRPRPVEYNSDPEYHLMLKMEMEQSKAAASAKKKGGGGAGSRGGGAQSSTRPHTPAAETSEPQTPSRSNAGDFDASARPTPTPTPGVAEDDRERAVSPVSTASSAEEAPLAQRVKTNGGARRVTSPVPPAAAAAAESTAASGSKAPVSRDTKSTMGGLSSPMSPVRTAEPPQWLIAAKAAMMMRYRNDRFETILRKVNAGSQPEWRIKCLDCPGKLYTPGPGETLANYEVHLKNRQHRQRVNDRLSNETMES